GTHFDPDVVNAFFARQEEFIRIATRNANRETADMPIQTALSRTSAVPRLACAASREKKLCEKK
ncbi:MAG: hypothetical protein J0M01_07010, partial [Dechloromonas sp.]|nr:hypothetical protein [Dechloromonas sp.]